MLKKLKNKCVDPQTGYRMGMPIINHGPFAPRFLISVCFFIVNLFMTSAQAWNAPIHKEIFAIAWLDLSPEEQQRLKQQLHAPPWSTFPPLSAATWADHVKGHGSDPRWHYVNHAWGKGQESATEPKPNILTALAWLRRSQAPALSIQHDHQLRLLIHLIGDIHQPLHVSSHITPHHVHGDLGGTRFRLHGRVKNLHVYWDNGCFPKPEHWSSHKIMREAEHLRAKYPRTYFSQALQQTRPEAWANEGLVLTQSAVYDVAEGKLPSSKYQRVCQTIVDKRITLAGYRLADALKEKLREQG